MVLRVKSVTSERIDTVVEVGGALSNRKGVNIPDVVVPVAAMTDKDRRDLAFAVEQNVDWVALSFVQRPEDLAEARRLSSEEQTSELQSLMRISYAVFCLKKKTKTVSMNVESNMQ